MTQFPKNDYFCCDDLIFCLQNKFEILTTLAYTQICFLYYFSCNHLQFDILFRNISEHEIRYYCLACTKSKLPDCS